MTGWTRQQELERAYDGPIPADLLRGAYSTEERRQSIEVEISRARDGAKEWLRSARSWLLKGNRDMYRDNREAARICLKHYLELRAKAKE